MKPNKGTFQMSVMIYIRIVVLCSLFLSIQSFALHSQSTWRSSSNSPITTTTTTTSQRYTYTYTTPLRTSTHLASSSSSSSSSSALSSSSPFTQHRDVVIVGAGLAGLSIAYYLTRLDPTRHVTIVDGQHAGVASFAAAGMLAPNAERLPAGDLLDLCLASRHMYTEFVQGVEQFAQHAMGQGDGVLTTVNSKDTGNKDTEPWKTGYRVAGGFVAPAFAGDSVATWAPPSAEFQNANDDSAYTPTTPIWLDAIQVRELEPALHPQVVGGWWFPEDASIDARRLTASLRAACVAAGVQVLVGPSYEVASLDVLQGTCHGVRLASGTSIATQTVVIANGAWMKHLLPVPLTSHKGQSLSLRMPAHAPPLLRRVLFAQDSYLVPTMDGRILVGATVEAGSYDASVTPGGILHILSHALQLVPGLQDLEIEETWSGFRPTTPDKGPILGASPWSNLFLAGGYWRNGVLLAPKTGHLIASLIAAGGRLETLPPRDQQFLTTFAWDRFTRPEGRAQLAAQTRYAAALHPVHRRSSGAGVAVAVGTELGSYSSARAAREERQRDRQQLFGSSSNMDSSSSSGSGSGDVYQSGNDNDAFERAAQVGKQDAAAFGWGNPVRPSENNNNDMSKKNHVNEESSSPTEAYETYEGSADAWTVGVAEEDSAMVSSLQENTPPVELEKDTATVPKADLSSLYDTIRKNKSQQTAPLSSNSNTTIAEERPDPGFRIYYVDETTGDHHEVPPYTSPGDFLESLKSTQTATNVASSKDPLNVDSSINGQDVASQVEPVDETDYSEKTYDGYQEILGANSRSSRYEELEAMRIARIKNRMGQSSIDISNIGAQRTN
jgi:glycine/D-amino acid oxidase-like deaminating enzyme